MAGRKPARRRVDMRHNRAQRTRERDWTRKFREGDLEIDDHTTGESVRAKGELSRKREIHTDIAPDGLKFVLCAGAPVNPGDTGDAMLQAALRIAGIDSPFVSEAEVTRITERLASDEFDGRNENTPGSTAARQPITF